MNPYRIDGPAIISVSGGRTSGFMLRQILDAHGGALPPDVIPVFCNTGLEHAKTYAFLEEIGRGWCPVVWLEYRVDQDNQHAFDVVTPETASRKGEPFEALIRKSGYLPNPVVRKCTVELKLRTSGRYTRSLGWAHYENAIGLRADEPRRVAKMKGDRKAEEVVMPMAEAGHTVADVRAFWDAQPFDLDLPKDDSAFGNCVGCFLKSRTRLLRVFRDEPEQADWWIRMEALALASKPSGVVFRSDRPRYSDLVKMAQTPMLFEDDPEANALPCACTE